MRPVHGNIILKRTLKIGRQNVDRINLAQNGRHWRSVVEFSSYMKVGDILDQISEY